MQQLTEKKGYAAQATTKRAKWVARVQFKLAELYLNDGLQAFVEYAEAAIKAVIRNPERIGFDEKSGEPLAPGVISGLELVKHLVVRDQLVPTLPNANVKLGRIFSFSTLPIITCTDFDSCAGDCYAMDMVLNRAQSWTIFQSWLRNTWLLRNRPDIVQEAIVSKAANARNKFTEFRAYVAGDLFNQAEADFWRDVFMALAELMVRAYGYTKSDFVNTSFLRSQFTLNHTVREAVELIHYHNQQFYATAVTDTWEKLKAIQKLEPGLVICPELAAKRAGKENVPNCATCGLCARAVSPEGTKIKAIGFILH